LRALLITCAGAPPARHLLARVTLEDPTGDFAAGSRRGGLARDAAPHITRR